MKNNKTKILVVLLAIMIIVNAVLLYFLYAEPEHKDKEKGRSPIGIMLQDEIKFSPEQMQAYDTIKAQHKRAAKAMFQEIKKEKENSLKALVAANFSDSSITATAINSSQKQARIEETMLTNLSKIRAICTPAQLQQFDTSFYKAMSKRRSKE